MSRPHVDLPGNKKDVVHVLSITHSFRSQCEAEVNTRYPCPFPRRGLEGGKRVQQHHKSASCSVCASVAAAQGRLGLVMHFADDKL